MNCRSRGFQSTVDEKSGTDVTKATRCSNTGSIIGCTSMIFYKVTKTLDRDQSGRHVHYSQSSSLAEDLVEFGAKCLANPQLTISPPRLARIQHV